MNKLILTLLFCVACVVPGSTTEPDEEVVRIRIFPLDSLGVLDTSGDTIRAEPGQTIQLCAYGLDLVGNVLTKSATLCPDLSPGPNPQQQTIVDPGLIRRIRLVT